MISLDSTHKTCIDASNKDCYLYTIVARCRTTGKGKPLAWMITNSQAQYPILFWLKWSKDEHGFVPERVMIDDSDTEIIAINKAYNSVNDETSTFTNTVMILICQWHILKAWKKNILTKLLAKPCTPSKTISEKKRMREDALSLMMSMMAAQSPNDFDLMHEEFELWCVDNDDEWESAALYVYFENEHYGKREKWSAAWRTVMF